MDHEGDDQTGDQAEAPTPPTPQAPGLPPTGPPPAQVPPTFVPPASPAPTAFGAMPPTVPTVPTVPPTPPAGPPPGSSSDDAGSEGLRPTPSLTSMLAVGAGLLVTGGLFFLLAELDFDQRGVGIALSLLFVALGVALSTINRSNRAAAAGVAISALAVVPFTIFLFADDDVFDTFSGGTFDANPFDGIRGVVNLVLVSAAVLWLLGYVLNPARRFGFYLGAALVAIWLIPIFNVQLSATEDLTRSFSNLSTFDSGSGFDSGFDSGTDSGSGFDSGSGSDFEVQDPSSFDFEMPSFPDPSTKLGVISLGFGAAYLAFAAARDRKGDAAMATAALAPAVFILVYALALLTTHVGWFGIGLLGLVVGGAILAVGLEGTRRASSWIGLAVATLGFGWLLARPLEDSPRAIGGVLTLVGVAVALAVGATAKRSGPDDGRGAPPATPSPEPWAPAASAGDPAAPAPMGPGPAPGGPASSEERPPWSQPF